MAAGAGVDGGGLAVQYSDSRGRSSPLPPKAGRLPARQ
jgi:hypothetical protein